MADPLCPTPPAVVCSADPSVCVCEEKGDLLASGANSASGDDGSVPIEAIAGGVGVAAALGLVGAAVWQSRRSNAAVRYNNSDEAVAESYVREKPLLHVVPLETTAVSADAPAVEAPAEAPASTAKPINGHDLIVALLTDPENPGREGEMELLLAWDKDGNPTVSFLDGKDGRPMSYLMDGKAFYNLNGILIEASEAAELGLDVRGSRIDWVRGGTSVYEGGKGYVEFDNFQVLESEFAEIAPQLAAAEALGSGERGTINLNGFYPIETSDPRGAEVRILNPTESEIRAEAEVAIKGRFPNLKPEEQRAYVKIFERWEEIIWNEGLKEASGMEITPDQFLEMRRVHVRLLAAEFTGRGFKGEFVGMEPSYRLGSTAAFVLSGGTAEGVTFEGVTHTAMRVLNERRNAATGIESRERRGAERDRARESRPMEMLRGVR